MAPIPKPPSPLSLLSPTNTPRTPFPTSACGPHLEAAIVAVAARTQAPPELIAHHLLTLAAMAAQRLISVRLPTGRTQPVSSYFLTMAASGEGRSVAEAMCVGPLRSGQQRFLAQHARSEDGPRLEPVKISFLSPHRSGANDRYDRYARFARCSGLFAAVAADLLTPSSTRRNEADSLSALWDGGIVVTGAKDKALAPRLSAHLIATLGEGLALLRAPEVADSGLLGRLLTVQPASRIGARVFSESDGAPPPELEVLHTRLTALFARDATYETRVIAFSDEARQAWLAFANEAEAAMAPEGDFAPIRSLAGRLAEHAARLAAIIALVDDANLSEITPAMLGCGVALARFYANEALRLSNLRTPAPAEKDPMAALQAWLERKYTGAEVSLREIYCFGPAGMRSASAAMRAMRQLEMLGVVESATLPGVKSKGRHWRIPKAGDAGDLQHTAA